MVFQAGEGAGKSGSFFFFSHDNKLIIKTLQGHEKNLLLGMLDNYISHIEDTDNRSLLARIYGVFTIESNYFDSLDIMIMQNTCQLEDKDHPKMIFDIKGSTVNRKSQVDPKFWRRDFNWKKTMKDMNFVEIS